MRRDQLEHAIRAACQVIQAPEVIVVGSQSILGTYRYEQLPHAATLSMEIDILPMGGNPEQVELLSDQLHAVAGDSSQFEDTHGFSIDGVGLHTSILPDGWRARLVNVQNVNTWAPSGEPQIATS